MRPRKRSFSIRGHRTSLSLEEPFWSALKEIAADDGSSLADLVGRIDANRADIGLSTAVRIYILQYYRGKIANVDPMSRTPLPAPDAS